MRASVIVGSMVGLWALATVASAAPPATAPAQLGSKSLEEETDIDGTDDAALTTWRDALVDAYKRGVLAPFDVRATLPPERGTAYSVELEREVGKYRIKSDGASPKGVEITGVELPGAHDKALEIVAALKELRAWPVTLDGQVVHDCHVELVRSTRAELCLELPEVERGSPSAVTTEVRLMAVCPPAVKLDELAVVWLSPGAPAAFTPITSEPAEVKGITFSTAAPSRELVCSEGRAACISMAADGSFVLTKGDKAASRGTASPSGREEGEPEPVAPTDLAGFALRGLPTHWVGVEHKPTGLRILRSAIGTYHGLPAASQLRDLLAGGDCLLWHLKPSPGRHYPEHVDLGTLCLSGGAWAEGTYAATTITGAVLQSVQSGRIDEVATRCSYKQADK